MSPTGLDFTEDNFLLLFRRECFCFLYTQADSVLYLLFELLIVPVLLAHISRFYVYQCILVHLFDDCIHGSQTKGF